ncbi:energy transducer TonB [Sphingobium mellinum]|uniref:energy transducer TonB n=1 Tax=Sphingobium mellinum TaxID=1387166 RepID=UPI0030ECB5E8
MRLQATSDGSVAGYRRGGGSPIGVGGAIAVHAVVIGAFLLMPREVIAPYVPTILVGEPIPLDPPPPEAEKPQPPSETPLRPTRDPIPAKPDTAVDLPPTGGDMTMGGSSGEGSGGDEGIVPPPPRDPVVVDARIDPRALPAFQPDYPASMIRQGMEGSVTVRVAIGADGRVTAIERLSATDDAFWTATQRHALRKWRFRPATRDGEVVASIKVLTVHFRLTDL